MKEKKAEAKGSDSIINKMARFFGNKIQNSIEEGKLKRNKIYTSEPKVEHFSLIKTKEGSYESFNKRLEKESLIVLIFGKRGSGKSALGFRILENIYGKTRRNCCALGIKKELMPKWIHSIDDVETAPNGAVILVDEGSISFGSRESMNIKNRELSRLLSVARHKNLTIIFITQNTGLIDRNVLKLTDTLFIKEGSLLQLEMERAEIKKMYENAKKEFVKLKGEKNKYVYIIDSDFIGTIEHSLPSFWSESLSKNQASLDIEQNFKDS